MIHILKIRVRCCDTKYAQCQASAVGSYEKLKAAGWQFINSTPYIEESRVFCPGHARLLASKEQNA